MIDVKSVSGAMNSHAQHIHTHTRAATYQLELRMDDTEEAEAVEMQSGKDTQNTHNCQIFFLNPNCQSQLAEIKKRNCPHTPCSAPDTLQTGAAMLSLRSKMYRLPSADAVANTIGRTYKRDANNKKSDTLVPFTQKTLTNEQWLIGH